MVLGVAFAREAAAIHLAAATCESKPMAFKSVLIESAEWDAPASCRNYAVNSKALHNETDFYFMRTFQMNTKGNNFFKDYS